MEFDRVDKKEEYINIIYKNIYNILKNENYLINQFNEKEKNFFNFLRDFGDKITYEIYINSLIIIRQIQKFLLLFLTQVNSLKNPINI